MCHIAISVWFFNILVYINFLFYKILSPFLCSWFFDSSSPFRPPPPPLPSACVYWHGKWWWRDHFITFFMIVCTIATHTQILVKQIYLPALILLILIALLINYALIYVFNYTEFVQCIFFNISVCCRSARRSDANCILNIRKFTSEFRWDKTSCHHYIYHSCLRVLSSFFVDSSSRGTGTLNHSHA